MKRISEIKPGDIMVGRDGWKTLDSIRQVVRVRKSKSKEGKVVLEYSLEDRPNVIGKIRRSPSFYVTCFKRSE